jgi:glutathione S-transferase
MAPEGTLGEATTQVAAEKLRRPLSRLNTHLTGRDWLIGNRFTVADINTAECLRYAQGHTALIAEFPQVKRWIEAAQARPAFQKLWAARLAEPA